MLEVELPYPPSINHYWRRVGPRTLISREDRRFRERVMAILAALCIQPLAGSWPSTSRSFHRTADVAISTTGVAGPGGGSTDKPVGLVYFGMADAHRARSLRYHFGGDRDTVQERCVTVALNMLRLLLLDRLDLLWEGERRRRHG